MTGISQTERLSAERRACRGDVVILTMTLVFTSAVMMELRETRSRTDRLGSR